MLFGTAPLFGNEPLPRADEDVRAPGLAKRPFHWRAHLAAMPKHVIR